MGNYSYKAVYIIATCVAVTSLLLPGAHNSAHAQLSLPSVGPDLTRLPSDLDVDRRVAARAQRGAEKAAEIAAVWVDTSTLSVDQTAAQATSIANGLLRELKLGQDPAGADIEDRIVVVLVASDELDALSRPGFKIVAQQHMASLGLTMVTLRLPVNSDLPQAMEVLRDANPDAAIDYNHLYDFTASAPPVGSSDVAAETADTTIEPVSGLRVGVIDSAVMLEHRALAGVHVVARDFATAPGLRPQTHGTAVASLVARSSQKQASIYAASVFFQLPNRAPGATAESLVAALDWLVEQRVAVINMSLAGPGNQLLEAAIARLMAMDAVVIAAVGNNGPSGEPLYPAAYDGVIGITAVDRKNKVFRYANRGEQVEFAARGVDVKVADSLSGGWRIESGTSMASPHVAVIVAQALRAETIASGAVKSWLMANAEDLGRKGLDPVYGYGLITQPPMIVSEN